MLAYTKPKIIVLDDDDSILDTIECYLTMKGGNEIFIKTFLDGTDFYNYVEYKCYLQDSPLNIILDFYQKDISEISASNTLKDLKDTSSIIIIDHELRGQRFSGVDLSKKIKEYFPSTFVCMLTSNISNSQALKMHNDKSIDLFFDKKKPGVIEHLYTYLEEKLKSFKKTLQVDAVDVFGSEGVYHSEEYKVCKEQLINSLNPVAYLSINLRGDIAFIDENDNVHFYRFLENEKSFNME